MFNVGVPCGKRLINLSSFSKVVKAISYPKLDGLVMTVKPSNTYLLIFLLNYSVP